MSYSCNLSGDLALVSKCPTEQSLLARSSAVLTRCDANLPSKDCGQMALVDEADLARNRGQGLVGTSDKSLRPLKPPLYDITLWPNPDRLLKQAAEVVDAETGDRSQVRQPQTPIEMRLDVIIDTCEPFI